MKMKYTKPQFVNAIFLLILSLFTSTLVACGGDDDEPSDSGQSSELSESQFVGTWKIESVDSKGGKVVDIVELRSDNSATVTTWSCKKPSENPIVNYKSVGAGTWEISKNSLYPKGALNVKVTTAGSLEYYGYSSEISFSGANKFTVGNHAGVRKNVVWERYVPVNNACNGHYGYWEFVSYSGSLREREYSLDTESFTDKWSEQTFTNETVCLAFPAMMFTKNALPLYPNYNSEIVDWSADKNQLLFNMNGKSHTATVKDGVTEFATKFTVENVEGDLMKVKVEETQETDGYGLIYESNLLYTYQRKSTFEYEL